MNKEWVVCLGARDSQKKKWSPTQLKNFIKNEVI